MDEEAVKSPAEFDSTDDQTPDRWIWFGICAALVLFSASVGLLCFHWLTSEDPNCIIIVKAEGLIPQDATITIYPVLDTKNKTVMKMTAFADGQIRFHVPRNDYQLEISQPRFARIVKFSENSKITIIPLSKQSLQ